MRELFADESYFQASNIASWSFHRSSLSVRDDHSNGNVHYLVGLKSSIVGSHTRFVRFYFRDMPNRQVSSHREPSHLFSRCRYKNIVNWILTSFKGFGRASKLSGARPASRYALSRLRR